MTIKFTDKNGKMVAIRVDFDEVDVVMTLLSQLPDSEFISCPQVDRGY